MREECQPTPEWGGEEEEGPHDLLPAVGSGDGTGRAVLSRAPTGGVGSRTLAGSRGPSWWWRQPDKGLPDSGGRRHMAHGECLEDTRSAERPFTDDGIAARCCAREVCPQRSNTAPLVSSRNGGAAGGQARQGPGLAQGPHFCAWGGAGCEREDCTWKLGPSATRSCLTAPIWIFVRGAGRIDFFMTHRIELDHVSTPNLQRRIYPRVFGMSPLILKFLFGLRVSGGSNQNISLIRRTLK